VVVFVLESGEAVAQKKDSIGFVIAAKGTVSITSGAAASRKAALRQEIYSGDTIRTGFNSSTKLLFDDNSTLSVTENSEVTITEHRFDRPSSLWTTIVRISHGRIRADVAEVYERAGARFEIHTPTAIAAARGTDFVVWTFIDKGRIYTGIAAISGTVTVTTPTRQSVVVSAGYFTFAATDSSTIPTSIGASRDIGRLVQEAEVKTDPSVAAQVRLAQQKPPPLVGVSTVEEELPAPTLYRIPGQQWVQLGAGGISRSMGTTNTPCTFVSRSGNLPFGCTVPPGFP
jgi:hypothetical protein